MKGLARGKKGARRFVSAGTAAAVAAASLSSSAWALDITTVCSLEPQVAKLKTVNLKPKCDAYLANLATQPLADACNTCSTAIRAAQEAVDGAYATACGQSAGADAAGTAAAKAAGAADPNAQTGFLSGDGGMVTKAAEAVGIKKSSAMTFGKEAETCAAKVKTACQGGPPDVVAAGNAAAANCSEMAASSYALGGAAGSGVSTLSDMAQYAMGGAALLGLGAMAYGMLKGKGSSNNGAYDPSGYGQYGGSGLNGTSPTPESPNTSSTVTSFTDKTQPDGVSLGSTKNATGASSGSLALGGTAGNRDNGEASIAAEQAGGGRPSVGGKEGGMPSADLGGGKGGALAGASMPPGLNGGGAGEGSGRMGASSAGEFSGRADAGLGGAEGGSYYDLGAVGGKTGAILGMSSSGEMKDLDGALGATADLPKDLDGNRALASEGAGANAQRGEEGGSLFHMIRARYAELKKKGHI